MILRTLVDRARGLLHALALPVAIGLGAAFVLLVARHFLLRRLHAAARRRGSEALDVTGQSLRVPTLLWCVAFGVAAALEETPAPGRLAAWGTDVIVALVILSATMVAAAIATHSLQRLAERRQAGLALTGLGTTLTRVVVFLLGGLVILETLGIPISPLVTALGVGGIAVALALQDILSNLIAGIYLVAERPVRVGDIVKLETGQEGPVIDIGWRTTRVALPPDSVVVVPNGKLAQSVLSVRDREEARPAPAFSGRGRGGP